MHIFVLCYYIFSVPSCVLNCIKSVGGCFTNTCFRVPCQEKRIPMMSAMWIMTLGDMSPFVYYFSIYVESRCNYSFDAKRGGEWAVGL